MQLTTLCYVKCGGKTLMLHRIKKQKDIHEGKWNGLGGHMEQGETPEECIIREVYEESGLKLVNPRLRGILTFPMFDGIEDEYTFLYTAEKFEGALIDSPEGMLEWIDDAKVPGLNLWEGDKIFLEWLEDGRLFSGKLIYSEGRLTGHKVVFY
ncbi:MAG TPA: 8-oxo-dGTP diphosphatase [Clostridia bacterium]|nr:8-oxo-dGTP diphosphatase [Clostridia bacterium]